MPQLTINLSEETHRFLLARIALDDTYGADEIVEEALRMMEDVQGDDEARLALLRAAAKRGFEGAEGPDAIVLNTEEEVKAYMDEVLRRSLGEERKTIAPHVDTAA